MIQAHQRIGESMISELQLPHRHLCDRNPLIAILAIAVSA
jgi:hypothetical protein